MSGLPTLQITATTAPAKISAAFKAHAPDNWRAQSYSSTEKGGVADSVWFKRAPSPGQIGILIRLHVPTLRTTIEPLLSKGYFYSFINAMQRAVWEWQTAMDAIAGESPYCSAYEYQAWKIQRLGSMTYFDTDVGSIMAENATADDLL